MAMVCIGVFVSNTNVVCFLVNTLTSGKPRRELEPEARIYALNLRNGILEEELVEELVNVVMCRYMVIIFFLHI